MVVDCGSGTVDITVHEIHDDLRSLKELHRATGCPFGSTGVDREFENLLEDIFGSKFCDDFRVKLPSGYVTLMTTFEGRKRAANTVSSTPYNIVLPFSFIQSVRKWKGSTVDSMVKKYGSSDVSFDPRLGILRISASMMRKLFEPTCEKIVSQINSIIESKNCCSSVCDGTNLGYLFLVGGFAESQLLQSYIRSAFSSRLRVIIPQGVSSSILRGAVLFGLDPSIISVRRSKMTYGIGILNRFIHGYHPLSKLVVRDGVEWRSDIFDKFVLTDQSIATGDLVTRSYTPAKNGQKFSVLNIYCSERDDVRFITDEGVTRCGTLVLDLDDLHDYHDISDSNCKKLENNLNHNFKRPIKKLNTNQVTIPTTTISSPTTIDLVSFSQI
ncbi:heat shock 70 kDa protein 12A-like [Panonychus citri]|uniref:heat shock 70 kDa protein 12A-like n=1 Tax=Panonychus citri TaxID=50023 RepID=UPI0023078325|nr:heat shock 70 kDa protein 12A-like [Panonychus citri]